MQLNDSTSSELLARLQASEHEALELLARWASPLITQWLETRQLSAAEMDEVFQETLLAVYLNIDTYQPAAVRGFRSWLRIIAERKVWELDLRRESVAGTGPRVELPTAPTQDSLEDESDVRRTIWLACRTLEPRFSPRVWQAFWRTTALSQSIDAVATALEMTPVTVRGCRARVLAALRTELRFWS